MTANHEPGTNSGSWIPDFLRGATKGSHTNGMSGDVPDEQTSLLRKPTDHNEPKDGVQGSTKRIVQDFWILLRGSIPVILAYALQNSLQTISVLIVGRSSPEALSVAAFCYMFAMATAWLIRMGGTTAIDTLASASFTGSKDKHDLGII